MGRFQEGPKGAAKRVAAGVTALLLVATASATLGVVRAVGAGSAPTTNPPSTAHQEVGMTPGLPYKDPVDANTNVGRHLTITLNAASTRFDLSGRQAFGQSYNGSFVAPTIHLVPGQDATITLVNHLPVATNLHFHGLHVSPSQDSDNPFVCVEPGQTFNYHLTIPANHPLGSYWYHSHSMGSSCSMAAMPGMGFMPGQVENQIFAGLSGALVVGDDRTLLPQAYEHVTAHTMVFKDVQLDNSGHIPQNTATTSILSSNPTVRLVNAQLRPVLSMLPGETQLWRLVNAGADIFYQLQLNGHPFTVVNEDGRPVAQTSTSSSLLLPPGKRYDVLVTAPLHPTDTWLRTTPYSNGPQGDSYPNVQLVQVHIAGQLQQVLPQLTGPVPGAAADLTNATIVQHRSLVLSENSAGTSFFINGKQFAMNTPVFSTPAHVGTVEEWTITNTAGEDHPFHLHTNAFQVMSINGVPQPYTHTQDIMPVLHQTNGIPGKVVIRVLFSDYPGKWMFHCHIAAHEDNGMMSFINVMP